MMKPELLKQIRNILLRTALVCFLFNLLMVGATVALWDTWTSMTASLFHTDPEALGLSIVNFFAIIKFYVVFVLLAPALALHWSAKTLAKQA